MHRAPEKPQFSPWLDEIMLHKAACPSADWHDLVYVNNKWIMHLAIELNVINPLHCAVGELIRGAANLWGGVHECHPWTVSPQKTSCQCPPPSLPSFLLDSPLSASSLTSQNSPMKGLVIYTPPPCHVFPSPPRLPHLPLPCNFHLRCLVFPRASP